MTDTNDNPPTWSLPAYSFDVPEDVLPGHTVGKLQAHDLDKGVNGHVIYSVLSDWGDDVFSLNPDSGVFTVTSRLDYEDVRILNKILRILSAWNKFMTTFCMCVAARFGFCTCNPSSTRKKNKLLLVLILISSVKCYCSFTLFFLKYIFFAGSALHFCGSSS